MILKRSENMVSKTWVPAVLSALILGCSGWQLGPNHTRQEMGSAPVIVDHYAAPVLAVGGNWRIFLRARDEDGDMRVVAAQLYQAGVGFYTVSFTFLEEAEQAEVAGYLVLPFPRDSSFFDDRFDMRLLVRDGKDNRSEAITFPLRIGHWTYEELSEKWEKVADNRLGTIMLDLESSQFYNRGADNSRPGQ
jgi:hypothetical protein